MVREFTWAQYQGVKMNEIDPQCDAPATSGRRPWVAPKLTTLDIGATSTGASPNIQETVLTDASLAPS